MLTISLDEYGDFEGAYKDNGPVFIAGIIYDDAGNENDSRIERKRIRAYYERVIEDARTDGPMAAEFVFPKALHSNSDRTRNSLVVGPVKEKVKQTLSEFIKEGTYQGEKLLDLSKPGEKRSFVKRQGRYHIFSIIKSAEGMSRLLGEHVSSLAKDDYASNLYFHMADLVVKRLLFSNPIISQVSKVTLDLATRSSADLKSDDALAIEYAKLGYKENKTDADDGTRYYELTNPDMYRTAIAQEIIRSNDLKLVIDDFNVRSISYQNARKMEFLYMADSICSILSRSIPENRPQSWVDCIDEAAYEITGENENLIFAYDEIDLLYEQAYARYRDKDYHGALSTCYEINKHKGDIARHYKDKWVSRLENGISTSTDERAFYRAIYDLQKTVMSNRLDQDKCLYIFKVLEELSFVIEGQFHTAEARESLYDLYDIGVSAYCHIGDSKNAEAYYDKCKERASWVSLEKYLATRNKMVVFLCDIFDLNRAQNIAEENIAYQELIDELRKDIHLTGSGEMENAALGKAYSQKAQVLAFKRDPAAEELFHKAMALFQKGSANYFITQSYLLQFYLDMGLTEEYCKESEEFFGGNKNLQKQLKYIVAEGSKKDPLINAKYALYIYVRALYRVRLKEMTESTWNELQKFETKFAKKIGKRGWKLTGHPAEIILKYYVLIAASRGETEKELQYFERLHNCLENAGATEEAIIMYGNMEIAAANADRILRDSISKDLFQYITITYEAYEGNEMPDDGEERYQWLTDHFTYMYV